MIMESSNAFVMPGRIIGTTKEFQPSSGTYVSGEQIYAAIPGISKQTQEGLQKIISVTPKKNIGNFQEKSQNKLYISLGSEVYGRITHIKEDLAIVRILAIGDAPVNQYIEGILRKKNIREFEIDKLKVEHAFLPGDIIKAKVLSLGDSRKIYLTTASDELGVLFAKNQETNTLMLPFDWKEMICPISGLKEFRKTAKPEFAYFSESDMKEEK